MHLIVPFAAPLPDEGRAAAATLSLPVLTALRRQMHVHGRDEGDAWSLSPPHERVFARAAGWRGADGAWPFAAHQAAEAGIDTGERAWALLSPVHWHLGTEQVSLVDPAQLALDESTSRQLMQAVMPLLDGDGWQLHWASPGAWFASHDSFDGLPTASLDRVVGRNVDAWLGNDPAVRRLRRLQAELQMLLHSHPINAERESRGLLPVNSVWFSGCGRRQTVADAADIVVDESLRAPALAGDWPAWCRAWQALDAGALQALSAQRRPGAELRLSLCGERGSLTLAWQTPPAWRRWWPGWGGPALHAELAGL